jgi:hypothetical protein
MSHMIENYTASDNGTHVIIKQIIVTMDPQEYVRWADLLNMMLFYYLLYTCISLCWNRYKKKKEVLSVPAHAILVNDGEGVRVLNVSTE